jgi:hypothetical protein
VIIQKITEDDLDDYILTRHPRFRRALRKSLKEKEAGKVKPLKALARELGIELSRQLHSPDLPCPSGRQAQAGRCRWTLPHPASPYKPASVFS